MGWNYRPANEVHPSIKFDFNFSNKEINFLDTVVYKTQSTKLETKLYRKESNRQAHLHRKLEHSESLKRSILCTSFTSLPHLLNK